MHGDLQKRTHILMLSICPGLLLDAALGSHAMTDMTH